jgi:hypothetical protein
LALAASGALGLSYWYVDSLIDATPFPTGARVTLVRDAGDGEPRLPKFRDITDFLEKTYPATVRVYQAPAEQTMPLELIENPELPETTPGPASVPSAPLDPPEGPGSVSSDPRDEFIRELVKEVEEVHERWRKEVRNGSASWDPKDREHLEAVQKLIKDREHLEASQKLDGVVKKIWGQPREPDNPFKKRLRGPSGVVFVGSGTAKEGMVDGQVVAGSRAIVVADDQGGKENRGVLISILRDPALGVDPGVELVVRAANLAKDSLRTQPP